MLYSENSKYRHLVYYYLVITLFCAVLRITPISPKVDRAMLRHAFVCIVSFAGDRRTLITFVRMRSVTTSRNNARFASNACFSFYLPTICTVMEPESGDRVKEKVCGKFYEASVTYG